MACLRLANQSSNRLIAEYSSSSMYVVKRLRPKAIVVYGTAPEEVFGKYRAVGIEIIQFDSDTTVAHSRRKEVA